MTNSGNSKSYDLEERTAKFGGNVVSFCKTITLDTINKPIIVQLIRSATSIGANYLEANGASSKKDFANKIFICKKESQETRHWLRMFLVCQDDKKAVIKSLTQEASELSMIFNKITQTLRSK